MADVLEFPLLLENPLLGALIPQFQLIPMLTEYLQISRLKGEHLNPSDATFVL